MLDDGLEIEGLLLFVGPGGAEGRDDPGQRGVELVEGAAEPLAPERLGEVVEAHGIEEPGQVPVGPVDGPEEAGDLGRGQQPEKDGGGRELGPEDDEEEEADRRDEQRRAQGDVDPELPIDHASPGGGRGRPAKGPTRARPC